MSPKETPRDVEEMLPLGFVTGADDTDKVSLIGGVHKLNGGTPKWMVYSGKSYKMYDLGVPPCQETFIFSTITLAHRCCFLIDAVSLEGLQLLGPRHRGFV